MKLSDQMNADLLSVINFGKNISKEQRNVTFNGLSYGEYVDNMVKMLEDGLKESKDE